MSRPAKNIAGVLSATYGRTDRAATGYVETPVAVRSFLLHRILRRRRFDARRYGPMGAADTAGLRHRLRAPSHPCLAHAEEVREIVRDYVAQGVRRMIALRGDIPADGVPEEVRGRGYSSTVELIADLKAAGIREVMVGAHPEHGGGDKAGLREHVEFVKRKLDAGATLAITQFFLDNDRYYRLRDAFAAAGIEHRLAPGIMPCTTTNRSSRSPARLRWGFHRRCVPVLSGPRTIAMRLAKSPGASRWTRYATWRPTAWSVFTSTR